MFLRSNAPEAEGATAVTQDRQGFLWIGNQAGLVRWDGYRTRLYLPDPDVAGSLPDNYVNTLLVDSEGRLWIGTNAGGLARYEPQTDSFVTLRTGPGALRDTSVSALAEDGAGGLWIATGGGLDHWNGATGKVEPDLQALPHGRIQALLRDRSGALWVGTTGGLARRERDGQPFRPQAIHTGDGGPVGIRALFQDEDGRVWIGTSAHGAYLSEPGRPGLRPVLDDRGRALAMSESVLAIVQARPGEVWMGTANGGIVRIDTRTWKSHRERRDEARPMGLSSDEIQTLFRDRDGWIWVGSAAEFCGSDPRPGLVDTYFGGGPDRLVAHASVLSVLSLPSGRVWLGLGEGGIQILDVARGRIAQIRPDPAHPESALPMSRVTSMVPTPDGSLLVGTQSGLYRASADGSQIRRIAVPRRSPTSEVRSLWLDRDDLWIGGRDGLWQLRFAPQSEPELLRHWESEIGDSRVNVISRGRGSSLWIGTFGGLVHLDLDTGIATPTPLEPDDATPLRGWDVSSVLTDHEGRLWVGTFGRGIQVERRHDPQGARRFQRLSTRNGLPHNGVDRLLIDPQGTVWASTDGGIARIDPSDLTIRALRQAQGVGIATYWTGAGTVSVAGEPMFGGIGGLTVIHPDRLGKEEAAAPLTITEAHVGNQPVPPARLLEAPLQVNAENRNLMVEFAALDFAAPEFRRYSYRLLGFDSDWTVTPASRRLASYTNLPPGSYTLQLRSAPVDKPWGEPLEIPVQVQAAWFQRDSVRVGAGILFLLAVGALVHLRTVYLRRRQGELQRLVAERTAELEQRGRELQQSHEELRRSQEQLEKMAYFDPLTGLPNRRMFNDDLRQLIARSMRGQGDFALVLVDLDGFKQINDHSGHHAGDSLLVVVADRLRSLVRDSDCIARLGGDEFAVLLANNAVFDPERVEAMCARMLASLREPMLVAGQTMQITASLGIAPCPRDGASPDELYKAADTALYEAKRSGRNTWRWSMPKMFTYTV